MNPERFDRQNGIPMYRQLADYIKKQISSGVYCPGDVLPSEADYIREFNLSRTTVRLALGMVTNAGLVRREQGRGTIVVPQVHSNLPILSSFTEEARRYGREPSVELISCGEEPLSQAAANALSLPANTRVLKVIRLRLVDGDPIGLSVSWLNTVNFPQLREIDYSSTSLYQVFEEELGLSIRKAAENIRADLATAQETRSLKIKSGAPVLRMNRITLIAGEQDTVVPIEYVEAVFNGVVYSVDVELYRQSNQRLSEK